MRDRIHRIVSSGGVFAGALSNQKHAQTHTPQKRAPLTLGIDNSMPHPKLSHLTALLYTPKYAVQKKYGVRCFGTPNAKFQTP